jgi:hypothetical protein
MSQQAGNVQEQDILGDGGTAGATGATGGGTGDGGSSSTTTGGGQSASWRDSLPEDIRGHASLKAVQDVGALAKGYIHAQSMVGAEKIAVPSKHATDEDWTQVYRKLGLPESVDKYEVKAPEGAQLDEGFMKGFKEAALKSGVLPKQAEKLVGWYSEAASKALEAQQTALQTQRTEGLNTLKKEWGQGWDKNVAMAKAAVKEYGGEEFGKFLKDTGLTNDPAMIKFMAKLGSTLTEAQMHGAGSGRMDGLTPAEAQTKINTILSDATHPYNVGGHPNHDAAVKEVQGLWASIASAQSA